MAAALGVAGRTLQAQGMADVLDLTIAYPKNAAWSIDPYDVVVRGCGGDGKCGGVLIPL
jgi:hypothetical protein